MTDATISQIIAASAGITGTVIGSVIGWLATWKLEKRRWKREDETRYHERRLAVYTMFHRRANQVLSRVTLNAGIPDPEYDGYLFATSEAMLIASTSVRRCIDEAVGLINPMFIPGFAGNRAQQNLDCVAKITEFLGEARSELSVDLAE